MIGVIIFPAAAVSRLRGRSLRRSLLRLGDPMIERAGVPNRRVAFTHDWSADQIADLAELCEEEGINFFSLVTDALPANWRWPIQTGPAYAPPVIP